MLTVEDTIGIYSSLLSSIDTIWNIYVFVLLGMVGWIVARAHEFRKVQKVLITIIFSLFNGIIVFYFYDAYADIGRIRIELQTLSIAENRKIVGGGISENLITSDPSGRFWFSFAVIGLIWLFVTYLVWARKIWQLAKPSKAASAPSGAPTGSPPTAP